MKVIEVIDKCEALLDVPFTREDLVKCFNVIEQELARDHFPLYATHQCNAKVVRFDEFEYAPVRIVMCDSKFKLHPTHMESKKEMHHIQYAYAPNTKELLDECSYGEEFIDCLVHGIITEYLCTQYFFEEAIVWDKKYKKEIQALYEVKE